MMDKKSWERWMAKANAFRNTREFQEYCLEIYRKNRELIIELIKWRTFLHIKPGSNADAGLAFLIHKTHQYHRFRWREVIKSIMEELVKLPPGMWETYLQIPVRQNELRMIEGLLAGKGEKHYPDNILRRRASNIKEFFGTLERFMKKGRVSMLTGPPSKYMPDWYFVARPENEFYKNEGLEEIIVPLIEKEKAEDNKKLAALNKLNELLARHSWRPFFTSRIRPLLISLKTAIENEVVLRNRIEKTPGGGEVHKLNEALPGDLRQQEELVLLLRRTLSETNIPNKGVHDEVNKLVTFLLAIIKKELR